MFGTLLIKELKAIIQSPKFVGSFAICSLLILISIFAGIQEYRTAVEQHQTATTLAAQQLREASSWSDLGTKAYREPDPMQIFISGLSYDIGRWSSIGPDEAVKLRHSAYSDDPIFAVFRFVDFGFIVMFVLSLLAIQFTYDAINGERESGTLKLVFSNAVPRAQYLIAKCVGSWLGLAIPLGIPVLAGLLLVLLMGVPLTAAHWSKIAVLIGLSLLLFTFFILLGVFVSTLTRRSSVSFLVSLLIWVALVMVIPRAGVMAAGGAVDVPTLAEMEAEREAFASEQWSDFYAELTSDRFINAAGDTQPLLDSMQKAIDHNIDAYGIKLREEFRQRRIGQESLAWSLSRISPASAYQLAAMALAETNGEAKARYEDAMSEYRRQFNTYSEAKEAEAGDMGGIRISVEVDEAGVQNLTVDASRDNAGLDISDVPRFSPPSVSLGEAIAPVVLDFGLLTFYILLVFAASFTAFLRYDVR